MYNEERSEKRRLYVASFADDMPTLSPGGLIPRKTLYTAPEEALRARTHWYLQPAVLLTFSVLLFALSIGTTIHGLFGGQSSVAAPIAAVSTDAYPAPEPFNYGMVYGLSEPFDAKSAVSALIDEKKSFIEIDASARELRFYASGSASTTYHLTQVPERDSWWHIPAGEYAVREQEERRYSRFANIYQPWSIRFGENYYINGVPYYPDEERVPARYRGGGVRLADADAESLFKKSTDGMPVVVRRVAAASDDFLYEYRVDGLTASEYLVADLKSSTVLAVSDLDRKAPIASLVKLMTALVATEHIDLDRNVRIHEGANAFVSSLVPRLRSGSHASMYSLLQLLMVESSNEAAEVIASVPGRATFIELMNEKADAIGLSRTTFTDPSGLDDGNVSSVGDLFRLVQYIFNNRGFILELTADQHLKTAYTSGQFGELVNFNEIDGVDFVAGKVGETEAAGQTSVSLHQVKIKGETRTIAIVLLGSSARRADTTRLIETVTERFGG